MLPVKYATAVDIYLPAVTRGAQDYLLNPPLGSTDAKISIDGVTFNVLTASLPSVSPAGGSQIKVSLSAAETTGKLLNLQLIDTTSPKAWEDQSILLYTYGHASAHTPIDLSKVTPDVNSVSVGAGAVTSIQSGLALDATVAKDATVSKPGTAQTITPPATMATLAKENDILNALITIDSVMSKPGIAQTITPPATMATLANQTTALNALITIDTVVDAINSKTTNLPASPANEATLTIMGTSINAIKAKTDLIVSGGATEASLALMGTSVNAIKAKTDTLPATPANEASITVLGTSINAVRSRVDLLSTQASIDVAGTSINAIKAKTDLIVAGGALEASITTLGTSVNAIKAKTDNLPASPANEASITIMGTSVNAIKAKTDLIVAGGATEASVNTLINGVSVQAIRVNAISSIDNALSLAHGAGAWDATVSNVTVTAISPAALSSIDTAVADAVWDEVLSGHTGAGSSGQQLRATRFADGIVYHDGTTGAAGITYPLGEATTPVNNLADAILIASANKLNIISTAYNGDETLPLANQLGHKTLIARVKNFQANLTLSLYQSEAVIIGQIIDFGGEMVNCQFEDCNFFTSGTFDGCYFYRVFTNASGTFLRLKNGNSFFSCCFGKNRDAAFGTQFDDDTIGIDGETLLEKCSGHIKIYTLKGHMLITDFEGKIEIGVLSATAVIQIKGGMGLIVTDPGCLATVVIEGFYPKSGGMGITSQEVRDSMQLSPTTSSVLPEPDSVDEKLDNLALETDPEAIADAVWDENMTADHQDSGSFGLAFHNMSRKTKGETVAGHIGDDLTFAVRCELDDGSAVTGIGAAFVVASVCNSDGTGYSPVPYASIGWQELANGEYNITIPGNYITALGTFRLRIRGTDYIFESREYVADIISETGFEDGVYVDQDSGISGTGKGVGTITRPVNNYTDAVSIAVAKKVRRIVLAKTGDVDINSATYFTIESLASPMNTVSFTCTISNGAYRAIFRRLRIQTPSAQDVYHSLFEGCVIANGALIDNGQYENCVFEGALQTGFLIRKISNCQFAPSASLIIPYGANIYGCQGELTIKGMTDSGANTYLYGFEGKLIRHSTCTAGHIYVIGGSVEIDDSAGTTPITVLPEGEELTSQKVRDAMKLAPTAGASAEDSVDDKIDVISERTDKLQFTDTTETLPVSWNTIDRLPGSEAVVYTTNLFDMTAYGHGLITIDMEIGLSNFFRDIYRINPDHTIAFVSREYVMPYAGGEGTLSIVAAGEIIQQVWGPAPAQRMRVRAVDFTVCYVDSQTRGMDTDVITDEALGSDAVVEIQAGLALEASITVTGTSINAIKAKTDLIVAGGATAAGVSAVETKVDTLNTDAAFKRKLMLNKQEFFFSTPDWYLKIYDDDGTTELAMFKVEKYGGGAIDSLVGTGTPSIRNKTIV